MEIFSRLVLHSLDGIVYGWLYALIAFGLSLIFGLLNVVNVAHGTLYMLGAVFGWYFAATLTGGNFWVALVMAPVVVCVISMVIEVVVLRPIEEDPDMTILSTFGILLIVENIILIWIGGQGVTFDSPFQGAIPVFGFRYSLYRLFVMGVSIAAALGLWWFLQKTKYGLWIRAVRMNTDLSVADGIPVKSVNTVAFGLGGLLAGLSGVLAGPFIAIFPTMGLNVLIIAFIVVIVGGLGDLFGAVVAGLILGVVESITSIFIEPTYARVLALLFVTSFLFFRPNGLFGRGR
jgi:branched-chain amino acid transport system permease protein